MLAICWRYSTEQLNSQGGGGEVARVVGGCGKGQKGVASQNEVETSSRFGPMLTNEHRFPALSRLTISSEKHPNHKGKFFRKSLVWFYAFHHNSGSWVFALWKLSCLGQDSRRSDHFWKSLLRQVDGRTSWATQLVVRSIESSFLTPTSLSKVQCSLGGGCKVTSKFVDTWCPPPSASIEGHLVLGEIFF